LRSEYRYFLERGEVYIIEVREAPGLWTPIGDVSLTPETVPIVIGVPAYRNRGLGKRVLRLVIRRARDLGWARLKTKGIWTRNYPVPGLSVDCLAGMESYPYNGGRRDTEEAIQCRAFRRKLC
jgi:GNAT superfamily N-acetyltransferase